MLKWYLVLEFSNALMKIIFVGRSKTFLSQYICITKAGKNWHSRFKVFPSLLWWLNWRKTNITRFKYKTTITRGSQPRAKVSARQTLGTYKWLWFLHDPVGGYMLVSEWCVSHHCPLWTRQNGSPQSQHLPCAEQGKTSGFLRSTKKEQMPELLRLLLPKNTELPKAPAFPSKLTIRNGWSSFAWTAPETLL